MSLYEYKLEHFGKVLFREPTYDDWHWNSEEYGSQYYIGTEKPKIASILPKNNIPYDYNNFKEIIEYQKVDIKNFKSNKVDYCSFYLTPPPTKPFWISENINWHNVTTGKYKKLILLKLDELISLNKRFPTVGTTYIKCLITTPHDNRTHIEWVLKKWIMPLSTISSVDALKEKLLKEFKSEKKLR
jgi:hypothetical protein